MATLAVKKCAPVLNQISNIFFRLDWRFLLKKCHIWQLFFLLYMLKIWKKIACYLGQIYSKKWKWNFIIIEKYVKKAHLSEQSCACNHMHNTKRTTFFSSTLEKIKILFAYSKNINHPLWWSSFKHKANFSFYCKSLLRK